MVNREATMESTMLTSTTRPGRLGSRAWNYLWAVTEMALRLLTNGRWGAPPAIWLALVCHMTLTRIRGILRMLGAVFPARSHDWARGDYRVSMLHSCGAAQSTID